MKRYDIAIGETWWKLKKYLENHQEYNVINMHYNRRSDQYIAYYWYEEV